MSNYWKLSRHIIGNGTSPDLISWPAEADIRIIIKPGDFFGNHNASVPRSSILGETTAHLDGISGKFIISETGDIPKFELHGLIAPGSVTFTGNIVTFKGLVDNLSHLASVINWISAAMTEFLSVQIGIYTSIESIEGTVAGRSVIAIYAAESYGIHLANVTPEFRLQAINKSLKGLPSSNPSYNRYLLSCRYYHHALHMISPAEINYLPYAMYSEVLLNLAKSIEILFNTGNRDALRTAILKLGYTSEQIESQIIPILVIRNDIDVGHPSSGDALPEDISTLRQFVDRSVINVTAILQNVWDIICEGKNILEPMEPSSFSKKEKLISRLRNYLSDPPLNSEIKSPTIFSCQGLEY